MSFTMSNTYPVLKIEVFVRWCKSKMCRVVAAISVQRIAIRLHIMYVYGARNCLSERLVFTRQAS